MNNIDKKFKYDNGTLKNKLGITDSNELENISYQLSAQKATAILQSNFKAHTIDDLNKIHNEMFGELFDWAGKNRDYEISKNVEVNGKKQLTNFLPAAMLDNAGTYINQQISDLPKGEVPIHTYAELLDNINELHPFREGNGRVTKVFLECLAKNHGQSIDYPRNNQDMIIAQATGNVDKIAELITVENRQDNLFNFSGLTNKNQNLEK